MFVCTNQDVREDELVLDRIILPDVRTLWLMAYEIGRWYYQTPGGESIFITEDTKRSAASRMRDLGSLMWYATLRKRGGRNRKLIMDVDDLVNKWHVAVVALALAHDKDEADRVEASIESCLSPLLSAPIKQIREFAPKLLEALKNDLKVPFLVWRGYERWIERVVAFAPDAGVRELKTELARQIAEIVEEDLKPQLGEALVRALQWRSPEQLEKVAAVVQSEKEQGRAPRLRGKESCLFMECGGTEDNPEVTIQI